MPQLGEQLEKQDEQLHQVTHQTNWDGEEKTKEDIYSHLR